MHKNAVFVRAGGKSSHRSWLENSDPKFDLIVIGYEGLDKELSEAADLFELIPGTKVRGWFEFFSRHPEMLERYERFAFMDDDLICSASDINRSFELGENFNLSMWQPSLTEDSYFTYSIFQKNPLFLLRYVNYIEMMCPFMTADTLKSCMPLFDLGYETGIDRLWCCLSPSPDKAYAVLDDVSVRHTRKVGENSSTQGFSGERNYQAVVDELEVLADHPYTGSVAYAGLTRSGRLIENRKLMSLLSLVPLKDWKNNPSPRFAKRFMISLNHNLNRPINNDKIDIDRIVRRVKAAA